MAPPRRTASHYRGCLLGGAAGDALGAPVEFECLSAIRRRFGPGGIRDFAPAYGRIGAITDDTQMTLWTAEGLLREASRRQRGPGSGPASVQRAYLRWLESQGEPPPPEAEGLHGGWLRDVPELRARRAPGNSCLSALRAGRPMMDSKGCGTVMRVAPVGLMTGAGDAFQLGCDVSALTHGHPTGVLAGGFLAQTIRSLAEGESLRAAVATASDVLALEPDHDEVARAVASALRAADEDRPRSASTVEALGAGWVAEEALAIALYCALVHEDDFEAGVALAVNHSGDSDSTGAIAGNLLGLLLGEGAIPARWLDPLELRTEIAQVAEDLLVEWRDGPEWRERYPAS